MAYVWIGWVLLLGLIGLVWVVRQYDVSRYQRTANPLCPTSFEGPPADAPMVSVLVAAKDEEQNIESCVTTMLDQDYPHFEVIVINDRSADRTREIAEGIPDSAGRLTVLSVTELRDGWFGKNNAMREGVERARADWLCFTDADCRQVSRRTLSMAVRYAVEHRIDFLSVLPVLETGSLAERIIQPVAGALMVFWFNPQRVNDPASKTAYANGAFMLMSRKAYEAIGGHERVRTQVNEDMHMARFAKEQGLTLHVVENRDLYLTRMYTSFREIWRGWSRIFYGCFGTLRRLVVSFVMMFIFSFFPWASAAVGWIAVALQGWDQAGPWRNVAIAAVVTVVLQQLLIARFYRVSQSPWWYAPTYVLGTVAVLGMLVSAMSKIRGYQAMVWRGDQVT